MQAEFTYATGSGASGSRGSFRPNYACMYGQILWKVRPHTQRQTLTYNKEVHKSVFPPLMVLEVTHLLRVPRQEVVMRYAVGFYWKGRDRQGKEEGSKGKGKRRGKGKGKGGVTCKNSTMLMRTTSPHTSSVHQTHSPCLSLRAVHTVGSVQVKKESQRQRKLNSFQSQCKAIENSSKSHELWNSLAKGLYLSKH